MASRKQNLNLNLGGDPHKAWSAFEGRRGETKFSWFDLGWIRFNLSFACQRPFRERDLGLTRAGPQSGGIDRSIRKHHVSSGCSPSGLHYGRNDYVLLKE